MTYSITSPARRLSSLLVVVALVVLGMAVAPQARAGESPSTCTGPYPQGQYCTKNFWGGRSASVQTAPGVYSTANVHLNDWVTYPGTLWVPDPTYTHRGSANASVSGFMPSVPRTTFENTFTYEGIGVNLGISAGGVGAGIDVAKSPNSISYKMLGVASSYVVHNYDHVMTVSPGSSRPSSVRHDVGATFVFGGVGSSIGHQVRVKFAN